MTKEENRAAGEIKTNETDNNEKKHNNGGRTDWSNNESADNGTYLELVNTIPVAMMMRRSNHFSKTSRDERR